MDIDEGDELDRVCLLLVAMAEQMSIKGFSIKGGFISLENSLDSEGPLTWALFMHSSIMSKLSGVEKMPFKCVEDKEALFGYRGSIISGGLPLSFSSPYLYAALEHAVVLSLQDSDCTHDEWVELPDEMRVISIEMYVQDLGTHWIDARLDTGSVAEKVQNWPVLLDFALHKEAIAQAHSPSVNEDIKISDLVSFAPKQ